MPPPARPLFARLPLLLLVAACRGPQSALDPAGPAAQRIADLWWLMLAIATAVGLITLALLGYALFRRRPGWCPPTPESDRAPTRWILIGGAAVPAAILLGVFLFTLHTLGALAARPADTALTVEVTGKQWWWEVRYLDDQPSRVFATANEIRIPVGRRVRLLLESDDVVHSFWVPQLNGKMDLVPGRTNALWILADRPGVYRGQCAEFCGMQHANMALVVVAEPPARFAAWLERQRRPAAARGRGERVFLDSGCAVCHTVRGTPAGGVVGPDLTHLATRLTLAAGMLPNTPGHLGGWIGNPQEIKPGNHMPRVPLTSEEFSALLHYLQNLR